LWLERIDWVIERKGDAVEYMRRHESKNSRNQHAKAKTYIEEDDNENPYYRVQSAPDKNYAGRAPESKASTTGSSYTKARDARQADKVVAREEVRAKEEARDKKAGQVKSGKVALKANDATKVWLHAFYHYYYLHRI
jgi:hypothetical protein